MGMSSNPRQPLTLFCAIFISLIIQGCANTVKYGEASRAQEIRTEVGINELQTATQKLISKMLQFPSIESLTKTKRPTIAIDAISNHTQQNLDTTPMTASVFKRLTASGKFKFSTPEQVLTSRAQAKDLLDYGATTQQAAAKIGKDVKADLVIYGSLVDIIRTKPTNKEVYYRISLQLLDTKTGKLIWRDDQEILKSQRKAIYGI